MSREEDKKAKELAEADDSSDDEGEEGSLSGSDDSEDSEDERIMNELQNVSNKKRNPTSSSSSSSSSKKQRKNSDDDEDDDDDDDDDDEVKFVEDTYEDLEVVNIIPRAKRGAAIRSGLAKGEDGKKLSNVPDYANLGSDEEEEEF
jgi:hypothetical protein